MLCPKCGKAVDMMGTEWVQLFMTIPMKWSPTCHRDCAVEIKRDFPSLLEHVRHVPTNIKRASRMLGKRTK